MQVDCLLQSMEAVLCVDLAWVCHGLDMVVVINVYGVCMDLVVWNGSSYMDLVCIEY